MARSIFHLRAALQRMVTTGVLAGLLGVSSLVQAALPPEHEANRLLLSVEQLVNEGKWEQASAALSRLNDLQTQTPTVVDYYRGKVALELGDAMTAQTSLEKYVVTVGAEGSFYAQALKLLTRAEQSIDAERARTAVTSKPDLAETLAIQPNNDYVQSLQKQYKVNEPQQALVLRINALLHTRSYQGARIRQKVQSTGIGYKLSVDKSDLVIQEKLYASKGAPEIKLTRLRVLGVDPYIRYGCDYERYQCWIYHPVHQYDRWLLIDRSEDDAKELAQALTHLLRQLQQ